MVLKRIVYFLAINSLLFVLPLEGPPLIILAYKFDGYYTIFYVKCKVNFFIRH